MKAVITLSITPFHLPSGVSIAIPQKEELGKSGSIPASPADPPGHLPLSALSEETLAELCENFRQRVYKSAGLEAPQLVEKRQPGMPSAT